MRDLLIGMCCGVWQIKSDRPKLTLVYLHGIRAHTEVRSFSVIWITLDGCDLTVLYPAVRRGRASFCAC